MAIGLVYSCGIVTTMLCVCGDEQLEYWIVTCSHYYKYLNDDAIVTYK